MIKTIQDLEEKFAILGYEDVKADEKLKVAYIQNLAKIPVICCKVDDGGAMVNEIRTETNQNLPSRFGSDTELVHDYWIEVLRLLDTHLKANASEICLINIGVVYSGFMHYVAQKYSDTTDLKNLNAQIFYLN